MNHTFYPEEPKLLTIKTCQTQKTQFKIKLVRIPAAIALFKDTTAKTMHMHSMLFNTWPWISQELKHIRCSAKSLVLTCKKSLKTSISQPNETQSIRQTSSNSGVGIPLGSSTLGKGTILMVIQICVWNCELVGANNLNCLKPLE